MTGRERRSRLGLLSRRPVIFGISAFCHDSAAALVIDGKIVSAAQEETPEQIDHVVFYDKPLLKFDRLHRPCRLPGSRRRESHVPSLRGRTFEHHGSHEPDPSLLRDPKALRRIARLIAKNVSSEVIR